MARKCRSIIHCVQWKWVRAGYQKRTQELAEATGDPRMFRGITYCPIAGFSPAYTTPAGRRTPNLDRELGLHACR